MTTVELTWDQVLSWRMERQLLHRPVGVGTTAIGRRLAGVQARLASAADQAVAVRSADGMGGVAQALAERRIVKTWAMRGTLYLLAA